MKIIITQFIFLLFYLESITLSFANSLPLALDHRIKDPTCLTVCFQDQAPALQEALYTAYARPFLCPGEAFVKALSDVINKEFSNVKIVFDVSWVAFSIVLSLIFFNGALVGTREGTVISAVFPGVTVKFRKKLLQRPLEKIICR